MKLALAVVLAPLQWLHRWLTEAEEDALDAYRLGMCSNDEIDRLRMRPGKDGRNGSG